MGTAPRSPAQDRKTCSRQPTPNQARRQHRERPGEQHDSEPDDHAGQEPAEQPGRVREQPEQHEQPDLGQPAQPLGEAPDGGAVRQSRVAEHERGEVRRRGTRSRAARRAAP